jgi:hypothetical protein
MTLRPTEAELAEMLKRNPQLKEHGELSRKPAVTGPVKAQLYGNPGQLKAKKQKYGAVRTYSELCQRSFSSKAEARRGEELFLMMKAGEIYELEYQPKFILCESPKITYTADFKYRLPPPAEFIYEDVKGILTRETRVKLAWLKEKYGVVVKLTK